MANTSKRAPKEYQREALSAIEESRPAGRGLIVMASGLGKTMTAIFDAENFLKENQGAKVMFLNDNISILEQAKKEFKRYFGDEYSYGLINSTSAPKKDVDFLFASFDTMTNRLAGYDATKFDYIVVDEAHHAQAPTYKKVIKHFQPKYLLGMTATPVRLDQKKIEELFGDSIYNLGFGRALAEGLLTPVKYSIMDDELNVDEIEKFMTSSEKISLNQLNQRFFIPKRDQEIVRIVRNRIQELGGKRTVIFCRNIQHAEKIASLMPEAKVVHSKMNINDANAQIEKFKHGEIATLIAVDKLNEGVDIPEIDVVVFLRTTTSPTILLQQMGRGLRLVPGKSHVHVLDFVANYERLADITSLQNQIKESIHNTTKVVDVESVFDISMPSKKFQEKKITLDDFISRVEWNFDGWTKESAIARIQEVAKELGRTPFAGEMYNPSCMTCAKLFGRWSDALRAAGFTPNWEECNYTPEQLIEKIQELSRVLGRTPTKEDLKNPSVDAYKKAFGSWSNALVVAGFEKRRYGEYTKEDLIERLQNLAHELNRIPKIKDPVNPSYAVYIRAFGTWNDALNAAGFNVSKRRRYDDKKELIVKLKEVADELGRTPQAKEISNPGPDTFIRVFGSWNKALIAAGFSPYKRGATKKPTYTDKELIQYLQDTAQRLGRVPTLRELTKPSKCCFESRFGSWQNALKAAGLK